MIAARPRRGPRGRRVLPAALGRADPQLRRRARSRSRRRSRASTSTATSRSSGRRRASSPAPGRSRSPSPRRARTARRSSRGRTSPATSPTTRSRASTCAPTRATTTSTSRPATCAPTSCSASEATKRTGYPAVSVFHDFRYDPKTTIKGGGARLVLRPPRRLLVDDRVLEPAARGRHRGLRLHRVDEGAPARGRPEAPALERRGARRQGLRRLVRVRAPAARRGRARRLGRHVLLGQRAAAVPRGRDRAALGLGALAPADLAAARGASRSTSSRSARARTRCGSSLQNTGWLPTNVTREGGRAQGRAPARGRADAARGRASSSPASARPRRASSRAASHKRSDALVGRGRLDGRLDEARVGDRGAGGRRARDRGAAPAGRHGSPGCRRWATSLRVSAT